MNVLECGGCNAALAETVAMCRLPLPVQPKRRRNRRTPKFAPLLLMAIATTSAASNFVMNGDFEQTGPNPPGWEDPQKACINPLSPGTRRILCEPGLGVGASGGLCIEIDEATAVQYGQGYFSDPIPVEPNTKYRLTADVKTDGPGAIVFVKGFAEVPKTGGGTSLRGAYSHHKEVHFDLLPQETKTPDGFYTISFEFQPRHDRYAVASVKVWLYAYLRPGRLCFDNLRIERLGPADAKPAPNPPIRALSPRPPDPDGPGNAPVYIAPRKQPAG